MTTWNVDDSKQVLQFPSVERVADEELLTERPFYSAHEQTIEAARWPQLVSGRRGFFRPSHNCLEFCNQITLHEGYLELRGLSLVTQFGYPIISGQDGIQVAVRADDIVYVTLSVPQCSAAYENGTTIQLSTQPTPDVPGRRQFIEPLARIVSVDGTLHPDLLPPAMTPNAVGCLEDAFDALRMTLADTQNWWYGQSFSSTSAGILFSYALERSNQLAAKLPAELVLLELSVLQRRAHHLVYTQGHIEIKELVAAIQPTSSTHAVIKSLTTLNQYLSESGALRESFLHTEPVVKSKTAGSLMKFVERNRVLFAVCVGLVMGIALTAQVISAQSAPQRPQIESIGPDVENPDFTLSDRIAS